MPEATTALIVVLFVTEKDVAAVPPNFTAVAPVKFVPVMLTVQPLMPPVGVNELTVGVAPPTVKTKNY